MAAASPVNDTSPFDPRDPIPAWWERLRQEFAGDLDRSKLARRLYSYDASIYEELPLGVARPRSREDCMALVRTAAHEGVPLIARGGGTSLAGQCVGPGLVVEFTRYLNRILGLDADRREAIVEPGLVQDDLNDAAAVHGLMFAPDTSTSRQATIGGMIGNNSAGAFSILFGTTREHVRSLEMVLADGTCVVLGPLTPSELDAVVAQDTPLGRITRGVVELIQHHRDIILRNSPKPEVRRRNTGYALDALAMGQPWVADGPPFNLARLVCGSEGTLGMVTSATLQLVPRPQHRALMCVHCCSVVEACAATPRILQHGPAAVELLDGALLAATGHHPEYRRDRFWVVGDPGAIMAVELWDDDPQSLQRRMDELDCDLGMQGIGYARPVLDAADIPRVWALRKAGLGLLTGIPGDTKPVTAIEDIAVAPEDLASFVQELDAVLHELGCSCVYYGHASVGLLHYRPMLNLKDPRDLETFRQLLDRVVPMVRRYRGSISGEHGDGRLRSPYLREAIGPELYDLCVQIKRLFDPAGIFNPGKIVEAPSPLEHLRTSPRTPTPEIPTAYDWNRTLGLVRATEACNGVGQCRQSPGRGGMCPTYMATRDEALTTRARANLFRQALTSGDPEQAWRDPELAAVMDTCVACKACRAECPSSVDVARLKSEWLYQRKLRGLDRSLRTWWFAHFSAWAPLACWFPGLSARVASLPFVKRWLGIAPARQLPCVAARTFSQWFRSHPQRCDGPPIVLFVDEFVEYLEPHIGIAAVYVLEALGYTVWAPRGLDSARALISKGFLDAARHRMSRTLARLEPFIRQRVPVIGLEPSAALGFRDEAPDLVPAALKPLAQALAELLRLFPEWIAEQVSNERLADLQFRSLPHRRMLIHGHCHQKSLGGAQSVVKALSQIPDLEVRLLPSACCGMAGAFGYEAEHYELSMALGEVILFPAIRADPEAAICADGTSCRQQVRDGTSRIAEHSAVWLARALGWEPTRLSPDHGRGS